MGSHFLPLNMWASRFLCFITLTCSATMVFTTSLTDTHMTLGTDKIETVQNNNNLDASSQVQRTKRSYSDTYDDKLKFCQNILTYVDDDAFLNEKSDTISPRQENKLSPLLDFMFDVFKEVVAEMITETISPKLGFNTDDRRK